MLSCIAVPSEMQLMGNAAAPLLPTLHGLEMLMPLIILPPSRLLSISDGDTPEVKMGVRLLGIDAPELHFPLGSTPEAQDPVFAKLPKLKAYKNLPQALRDYLAPRLEGAGTRQKKWGLAAKAAFEAIVKDGLAIPGKAAKRQLFMACGAEVLDRYGRILAYVGPYIPKSERGEKPAPSTFNLQMLQGGWAAPCIHKDNLTKAQIARRSLRGTA
jgi:endonuclease YncB( thermonuclease family)